ncbi:hypothetical protein EPUS_08292 [Endocarpon pusillum Z07020]|uniref:Oxo-4-hydroxy-4-carboxy-5-ureidoimidazoline decarboxylase domain-containing protein n=1 Tax=Endocarpon pusillum (strain Z07020 / HMAS-L-300199) TaxID=1263415 RepID=U1HS44_ENDPU|nr:uncharacterized protein EPUS_08292 [Endocarpon pusillum Z07020]ERF73350.1 hypothetical protein EPUS_08292 [Endocarpon pusillum Z07020]
MALPSISSVPSLSTDRRAQILDTLFEPCTQLHTLSVSTLHGTTYSDYAALISSIGDQLKSLLNSLSTSDTEWLDAILAAHPRLGEKKVDSELSRQEQAQLQNGKGEKGEAEGLAEVNRQYEERFNGLRYVVFVNGRSRHLIMEDMRQRIKRGNLEQEKLDAIKAICDIALDRVNRLGEEPEA